MTDELTSITKLTFNLQGCIMILIIMQPLIFSIIIIIIIIINMYRIYSYYLYC